MTVLISFILFFFSVSAKKKIGFFSISILFPAFPPYSPHSHPDSTHSHPYSPHSHPDFWYSHPYSPHSHPDSLHFPHSHPHSPHSHPDSPHSHPYSLHSHPPFPVFPLFPSFHSLIPYSRFYR